MTTTRITTDRAAELVRSSGGRILALSFVKRGDGSLRRMVARVGVRQGLKGGGRSFDAAAAGLLTVAEFVAGRRWQWRSVPVEGIRRLRVAGREYEVAA